MASIWGDFVLGLHLLAILFFFVLGWILPWEIMVVLGIVHQLHLRAFHGCILTNYEKRLHAIPRRMEFFEYVVQRFFHKKISRKQGEWISMTIFLAALCVSVIRTSGIL
ncbi:hypothetical protein KBD71_03800 [Candidatus Woesebacteria bacterium]|nr:hypothetical protein [Candidatus Woesebacteria bacterium]